LDKVLAFSSNTASTPRITLLGEYAIKLSRSAEYDNQTGLSHPSTAVSGVRSSKGSGVKDFPANISVRVKSSQPFEAASEEAKGSKVSSELICY
jgi:hypothetical protein|tara:strand:+ start:296 stop:577 length:282 start_codon:yes stop_codon:yes gene_type:complete